MPSAFLTASGARESGSVSDPGTSARSSLIQQLLIRKPALAKSLYSTLQVLIREKRRFPMEKREPLEHYVAEQLVQTAREICYCIDKRTLAIQDIKDMSENLLRMLERALKLAPAVGIPFGGDVRKFILALCDMATALQEEDWASFCPIDWSALADIVSLRIRAVAFESRDVLKCVPRITQLRPIRLLGAGGFGSVYKAIFLPSRTAICVKLVPEDRLPAIQQAASDKLVASIINSPFLVQYLCVFQAKGAHITMMEYVPGVDLNRLLHFSHTLPPEVLRCVVAQMFLGIEHLHLKGFVHRDIKVQNALIKSSGHLKVIDFDTNKLCMSHFVKNRPLRAYFKRTAREFRDFEMAGTLPYMAPECFRGHPYGRALDWWALGVTIFRLVVGRLPFRATSERGLKRKIMHENPDWSAATSADADAIDLAERLMRKNPTKRLGSGSSYREIRMHAFLQPLDLSTFHKAPHLCDVPHIREAMNPDNPAAGADSPMASKGSRSRVSLELRNLKDVHLSSMKPILTFVSPGFIRLMRHLRTLRSNEKPHRAFCDERKLYGLGTLSSELNFDWDAHEPESFNSLAALEAIVGAERFQLLEVRAEERQCLGRFVHRIDMREVNSVFGPCAFVRNIKGRAARESGLLIGDIIYDIDGRRVSEGLDLLRRIMRDRQFVLMRVFSINAFRLATQGIDVPIVFGRIGRRDLLVTRRVKRRFDIVQAFEIFTQYAADVGPSAKPLQVHMVAGLHEKLAVAFPPDDFLYVGDVLLSVNGVTAAILPTPDDLIEAMRKIRNEEVMITVLPISPLRYHEV